MAIKNGQSRETADAKQKHNRICVGHHYTQTKTNNVIKKQTTGDKDEPNIAFMRKS